MKKSKQITELIETLLSEHKNLRTQRSAASDLIICHMHSKMTAFEMQSMSFKDAELVSKDCEKLKALDSQLMKIETKIETVEWVLETIQYKKDKSGKKLRYEKSNCCSKK